MKKLSIFFVIFALCFSAFFNVYSINIDGYDDGSEWKNAESQIILNGESNCKVDFGLIKWITDSEINSIYLCVLFKEPGIASDNLNAGFSVQIDDSDIFIVNAQASSMQYNFDKYYFDGSVMVDDNDGVTCEARIGIKYGLPDTISGKIRFYDSEGSASNEYYFTIENKESETQKHNSYENNYTEKRTNASSYKTTSNSTKKATTTKKSNSNQMNINPNLLDFLLSSESTTKSAIQTTKAKTTSAVKTTRKSKSENKKKQETTKETEFSSVTETSVTETTNTTTSSLTEKAETKTSTAKLDAYKIITITAGGISLVVISVLGTLKAKKENSNENDRDS